MTSDPPVHNESTSALDAWLTPWRFSMLLAGLIILTFFNVVAGQETFFYRDFGVFGYPLAYYQRECFWRGELPLWNPLSFCGLPYLAQWNTMLLYPPALFYLVFPLSWSLGVFNLAHIFLAGLGMYFLARRWLGNNFAAGVAGIAFAFNGLTWHSLMWPNDIAGLGWMPFVVLFIERAWREGGKQMAAAAVIGAMQMLTGAPEVIILTWAICGFLWLGQFIRGNTPRGAMILRSAVAIGLVAGIAAAQLLPFLDLLKHSHRDTEFGASDWAMPLSGLANFIEPLFHCSRAGQGVFTQYDQYWTSSHYVGVGALLLAIIAAWQVRKGRVWLLSAVLVGSVWLALGKNGYLYTVARAIIPQIGFMRYPIKFVVVATFITPLLAGYAVRWCQESAAGPVRTRKSLQIVAGTLLVLLGVIVALEWKYPMGHDDWPMTWHNAIVRAAFLLCIPATLIFMQRAAERRLQLILRVALLVLLWMDVYTHAPTLSPTVSRTVYQPGIIRADMKLDPQPHMGEPRVMQTVAAADKVRFTTLSKPTDDYLCRRLSFYCNANLLDDVPKIDGFYSLYLREMAHVLGLIYDYDAHNIDLRGLKDFLGVAHISAADDTGGDKALQWINRTNYLPLVTAGQRPIFLADTNILVGLTRPDFDPAQIVFLPPETKASVTATNRTEAKIDSQRFSAQRLEMNVTAAAPAMVVVAQAFYHPWQAYVDGKRTKLWEANYAFQALEVPAGRHQVRLVYEDKVFRLGVMLSLGSLVICAGLWLVNRRQSSR